MQYLVDVQSRLSLFGLDGTAARGRRRCPASARSSRHGGREDSPEIFYPVQLAALSDDRVCVRSGRQNAGRRSKRPSRRSMRASTRPASCSRRRKTARACRSSSPRRKGLALDGSHPTMMYGYGGFSISTLPTYRSDVPAWLELGGHLGDRQHARRRGVRRGVAQGGASRAKAERVRRLHRGRRAPGQGAVHVAGEARDHGRIERRPARRRRGAAAPGSVRRRAAAGRRHGHAALRQVHRRPRVGDRVRLVVRSRRSSRSSSSTRRCRT